MSWFYRQLVRPVLFTNDPEEIHERTIAGLGMVGRHPLLTEAMASYFGAPALPISVIGLSFPNPIGLAAGMDKNGEALPAWAALGFGFCELGAVTWRSQPGNPPPRVFRVVPDEAIINRMGFNNPGAEAVAKTLAKWISQDRWPDHPVGMNLGKSKVTPLEGAAEDYSRSMRALLPYMDFFVVNVSSPNTPNLRRLQDKKALDEILAALQEVLAGSETPDAKRRIPILVKVAPDLSFNALDEILELVGPRKIAGIVATNTTVARPENPPEALAGMYQEAGGLSGRPLRDRSTEVIRHLYQQSNGGVPIVGVGGIFTAADAWEKITAGASLLQVYTGMVYEGPGLAARIVTGLRERLAEEGLSELREAVGSRVKVG